MDLGPRVLCAGGELLSCSPWRGVDEQGIAGDERP